MFTDTDDKIFLVSLTDKTQKDISLPRGIEFIAFSLNVMINGTPYFIVSTDGLDSQIKSKLVDQYPAQCHKIGDKRGYRLLTIVQYDSVKQKMNEKVDLIASTLVKGDWIVSLL